MGDTTSQQKDEASCDIASNNTTASQIPARCAAVRTGLVYDSRMCDHYCLWDYAFPESPARITEPFKRCVHYGLVERCIRIQARPATLEEIKLQHSDEYIERIKKSCEVDALTELEEMSSEYHAIYMNNCSWNAALLSLGSTIDLCKQVVSGEVDNGFAIVRPPGHHAQTSEACGYCFFNNVAIAAKFLLDSKLSKKIDT